MINKLNFNQINKKNSGNDILKDNIFIMISKYFDIFYPYLKKM